MGGTGGAAEGANPSDVLERSSTVGGGGLSPLDPPPPPVPMFEADSQNHLEERLSDQAQARTSYTPPF